MIAAPLPAPLVSLIDIDMGAGGVITINVCLFAADDCVIPAHNDNETDITTAKLSRVSIGIILICTANLRCSNCIDESPNTHWCQAVRYE